jgi:hypothetical protein
MIMQLSHFLFLGAPGAEGLQDLRRPFVHVVTRSYLINTLAVIANTEPRLCSDKYACCVCAPR